MTSYIILNAFQYKAIEMIVSRKTPKAQPGISLAGKTLQPLISTATQRRWKYKLKVPYAGDATWGDLANLRAAEALAAGYVSFTDHLSVTPSGGVYIVSDLPEKPKTISNLDGTGAEWFVEIELVERLT